MKFDDIPQFTKSAGYAVDVGWRYLEEWIRHHVDDYELDLDPDFQRAHVWTTAQQIRYVEFVLRGGHSSNDILTNCVGWQRISKPGPYVLVDGKQRLTAALKFLRNEIPVFGHYYKDFTDRLGYTDASFKWHVNDLETRAEVLQWYIDWNAGGVAHTDEEIEKVRKLLEEETKS
jgi:hypothetical protein